MPRKHTTQISIAVTPAEHEALHEAAWQRDYTSMSEMVRTIVFHALGIERQTIERGKYDRSLQDDAQSDTIG